MRRLIASIRLSHDTSTTNSPQTQRDDIEDWVAGHPGNRIDYWTEDLDVSGGVPIRDRAGIGPYLDDDRLDDWDGIIGYRLDRLFRSQLDYLLWVRDIGDKHGKVIIDTEDGTDTSTPAGRRTLNDRAQAADYERQRMVERRSRAARRIRLDARYGGGLIPFGLTKQRTEDGTGWVLVEYQPYADEVRSIVKRILAGESANAIAHDMNVRGIPTSRDAQRKLEGKPSTGAIWETGALLKYLRSPALKGYVMLYPKKGETGKPEIVLGRDGRPVRRAAILDDDSWQELQDVLGKPGEGRNTGRRVNAATMLLGVAVCAECGGAMHSERKGRKARGIRNYYGCANRDYRGCEAPLVPMDRLDALVDRWITASVRDKGMNRDGLPYIGDPLPGDMEIIEVRRAKGKARDNRMREIQDTLESLSMADPGIVEKVTALRAEYEQLRTAKPEGDGTSEHKTGILLRDYWPGLSKDEKRNYLQRAGVRIPVRRIRDSYGRYSGQVPEDNRDLDWHVEGNPQKVRGALTRREAGEDAS